MYDFKKDAVLAENCCKYLFFNAKSNQEKIGVYFGNNKKNYQVVPQVKSEKEL